MAIIDGVPGLEATIEVDGVQATEYNPPFHDTSLANTSKHDYHRWDKAYKRASEAAKSKKTLYRPHAVKYIVAKPGAPFNFRFKRRPEFIREKQASGIFIQVYVDGFQSRACRNDDGVPRAVTWDVAIPHLISGRAGSNAGAQTHWLRFKNIQTDEAGNASPEEINSQRERVREMGVLRLECFHMRHLDVSDPGVQVDAPDDTEVGTVPEEALKGKTIDCAVGFDTEPDTNGIPFTRVMDLDEEKRPFAVFEFRYRSREGLIQEGILPRLRRTQRPREQSPVLLEGSPAPADIVREMSEEEVRRLAQQLLEERGNGSRRSRAPSAVTPRSQRRHVRRERSESPNGSRASRAPSTVTPGSQRRRVRRDRSESPSGSGNSDTPRSAGQYKTRRLGNGRVQIDLTDDE
ncbi:hypothetical protein QBC37DRAFT_458355 [Rhypophila decipiens]|uniref:DUF7918 domain-containing protein n=1 Tax=Rhypophila decipiens TaxID=261697 RepID=A0AAN6XXY4_9PEZI|nr:hypothetical protein QBC37DRAFT_458355 [Rhypophila decipiens]